MAVEERFLNNAPRMTVALAAIDDYAIIEQVHQCLEAQSIRRELEIQFICRNRQSLQLPEDFAECYPDITIIEGGDSLLLNKARALGVLKARAPYVLILEDHCLPDPDCLERMVERLEQGWSAVGPAFVSGNRASCLGIAANLLTYGEWMGHKAGGKRPFIAGYNSAFATRVLKDRGDHLVIDLVTPSTLQQALSRQGHEFYFEARAVMAHWESSTFSGIRVILGKNGRGMGMLRARRWNGWRKLTATLVSPLLAGYRMLRGAVTWRRVRGSPVSSLLWLPPLALLWTAGEVRGYWSADRQAAVRGVSEVERNRQRFVDGEREPIRKSW